MLIVKLQGGLGNQMFQFATAKSLGYKFIYIDTDFLNSNKISGDHFTARDLELSVFKNINVKGANKLLKYLFKKNILFNAKYIYQSENNEFIDFKSYKAHHVYLDGYFQNEKYFTRNRSQLLKDFEFPTLSEINQPIARSILADEKAVAVHVRRGDYLKPAINAFHGLLPIEFYENARVKIEATVDHPNYYIFSDDIEWCKLNFKFRNSTFISDKGTANWEDMCLMSLCRHNIIANSSYSWWSAWLNTNPDKIVIAPKKWFVKQTSEIVPEKWLKI
jgi:hypothetical protein